MRLSSARRVVQSHHASFEIPLRRYESSAKFNASRLATGPKYNVDSGPVRPRGPSTMFCSSICFAQVSGGTAHSKSSPRVSKSSRARLWGEVLSENHISKSSPRVSKSSRARFWGEVLSENSIFEFSGQSFKNFKCQTVWPFRNGGFA